MTHDAGDGIPAHSCVAMVTVVRDLRSQFVVIACPTAVHNVAGVETGFSWFFCGESRRLVLLHKDNANATWTII